MHAQKETFGARISRLPRTVWMLGLVSLFMDASSEMIHAVLPLFLVGSLGLSLSAVGLLEGIAEATASLVKILSGRLSDRLGKRKVLALLGYGLAAAVKPLFPLADGFSTVLTARFIDRVGKGIRGAPRDALVADVTPKELRGAAYGLRQALDTVGALIGPVAAALYLLFSPEDFRGVFWMACLPALVCVLVLGLGVKEPSHLKPAEKNPHPSFAPQGMGKTFWAFLALAAFLMLPRCSEAFLLLRAREAGLADGMAPLLYALMAAVYAGVSLPAGDLSDRLGRVRLTALGFGVLAISFALLAFAPSLIAILAAAILWGAHLGLTQGALSALVADVVPAARRGTAFGYFHGATGLALLASNAATGALWEAFDAKLAFVVLGAMAFCGALALLWFQPGASKNTTRAAP